MVKKVPEVQKADLTDLTDLRADLKTPVVMDQKGMTQNSKVSETLITARGSVASRVIKVLPKL